MKIQRAVASALVGTLLVSSSAGAQVDVQVQSTTRSDIIVQLASRVGATRETPASSRFLKPLLRQIVASGAFDSEEGKAKLFEAIEKGLEHSRRLALKNLERLTDDELRAQVEKTRERALKDGNEPAIARLDALLSSPDGALRIKLRELHSAEKEHELLQRIKDSVAKSGSIRQAVEEMDGCWDYAPLLTEGLIAAAGIMAEICVYFPAFTLVLLPPILVCLALVPVGAVLDYVVIFPIYFFTEILPCEIGQAAQPAMDAR